MSRANIKTIISPKGKREDKNLDLTLRPQDLCEYIGQTKVKESLMIALSAAKGRKEPLEHILLYGPPGLGKTTLANIIAREMNVAIKTTSGPAIERQGDLGALLTNLEDGDILFIDECHRLNRQVEEILYPAMEDQVLDIIIGKGPSAKNIRLPLNRFTLIGATTKIGMLSSPLRDRFGSIYRLRYYEEAEIEKIIQRSAQILRVQKIQKAALQKIACCSRRTPRVANRLLKRVRDYAQVKTGGIVNLEVAEAALSMLEIDALGLDHIDRELLKTIIEKFGGGPVGLRSLSASSSEEQDAIEEVYEPFLLQIGLIARTPRGRIATAAAYEHLNIAQRKQKLL